MKILIGTVLKPQGILGQLKISDYTDGFRAIQDLDEVEIEDKIYKILDKKSQNGAIYLTLKGVSDRNTAELFRGKDVYAQKDKLFKEQDRLYIADLIGCDLYLSSGKLIGKIVDITSSNTDIFKLETSEGICYFPFLKKLNPVFDQENKKMTVDAKIFTEVCLYQ